MWSTLIPAGFLLGSSGLVLALLYSLKYQEKRRKKRSPLCGNLLRPPGQSLREKINDLSDDLLSLLTYMMIWPLSVYSVVITQAYFAGTPVPFYNKLLYAAIGLVPLGYWLLRFRKSFILRRNYRLAYDAELAAGEQLNQCMLDGYRVYHDFPAEGFNIDHVLVGSSGVFAVETKGRAKPITGNGTSDAEVIYDGEKLKFPSWTERDPLEQAKRQASWLRKWLSSATGEPVDVQPMIALPGWFIKRISPNGIPVINPKSARAYLRSMKDSISITQCTRIVHQLDQRCRDVEPTAYLQKKG